MKLTSAFLCWFVSKGCGWCGDHSFRVSEGASSPVKHTKYHIWRPYVVCSEGWQNWISGAMVLCVIKSTWELSIVLFIWALKHGWLYLPWEASGSAWYFGSRYMTIDALTSRKFQDVLMFWILSDRAEASWSSWTGIAVNMSKHINSEDLNVWLRINGNENVWREAMKELLIFAWLGDLSKPRPGLGPRPSVNRWKLGKVIELGIAESQIL